MRSTRTIVFGCALLAAGLIFVVIMGRIKQANAPAPNLVVAGTPVAGTAAGSTNVAAPSAGQIAVAATDIPAGSIVTAEMLKMKDSNGASTTGFITDINEQAAGYITRVSIPKEGQIRPAEDFIGHISQVGIAGALRPGTRALVLPLPGKPTLHDLVKIGNSVDVLAAFDGQESRTIVENVRVLAVDVFAGDYPPVKAAMRGAYKAEAQGRRIAPVGSAPGASGSNAGAPPDSVPPDEQPTPTPENLPPLDPALTLEVTPQQAAAIQLALASQAPLDFLVRPALPGNLSGEVTLVSDDGSGLATGANAQPIANSVTKRQIAPYAEAVKNRGAGNNAGGSSAARSNSNGGQTRTASTGSSSPRRNPLPLPAFPPITTTTSPSENLPTPFNPANAPSSNAEFGGGANDGDKGERLAPRAPSTYQIPIYADGGIVRTETVPVPIR